MRIDRLAFAAAVLAASTVMIGCGSDNNSNTPGNSTNITTPLITTPLGTTASSTMDTSSVATTAP